jgi:hypothetical protein
LIVGVGLKVTVRTGFRGSPLSGEGEAASRGVLSVVAVAEAIAATVGSADVYIMIISGLWPWKRA